ncbi:PREDICTED: scarecrow-like protein 1 [Ipomoea nil]|uniref:scarecrow-like protein 1 n=1 Tax=Ipomoea nil TaxID=35883 RepID=UPI000900F324|nr:PREDICTED: scarecrow-like protein 1 [Ipomoea nil]XP_019175165.1 PREDICTED: scarecrow-like protein 1 [Ipomoea nil]
MPLVRSSTPFGNRKLYLLNGHGDNSTGLSTTMFNPEKREIAYAAAESYSSGSYDANYFIDSPSPSPSSELVHPSASEALVNSFQHRPPPCPVSSGENSLSSIQSLRKCDTYQINYDSEYISGQSPDPLGLEEGNVRLKIQELERALLDDNDDDDMMFGCAQSMEVDPICSLFQNESSSSESNVSTSSSSNKVEDDTHNTHHTPKQLLFSCAAAIQHGNLEQASAMINGLRQMVSIQGEPCDRIAAYMVEALAARMDTSGKGLYKALKCKAPPSNDRLSAMQVLFEVCPCFRFGFMAANGAILEALTGEKNVHIIDFDINQGSQYYTLLQTLATMPGKPPHLRLTGIDDPESVQRPTGGLRLIGLRLEELAENLKLPFEFRAMPAQSALVAPTVLGCQPGETVIVNFAFQLHHMPDESVSTVNQRDQLLRMVKSLNPKLVTVVEQDVNTNTAPFLPRFAEAYNYYSAVFESLDATLPRDSQERMNVERHCLARDIINIIACEGEERIERYEVAGKWRARMMMAGFNPCPISRNVNDSIRKLIKQYSERYKVKEDAGSLHFGWEDKILIVASAWR